MSRKKSKSSKASIERREELGSPPLPLDMLQGLLGRLSDQERLELLETITGLPVEELLTPSSSATHRAANDVSRLIEQAHAQTTSKQAVPLLERAVVAARQALGRRLDEFRGRLGEIDAGWDYLNAKAELVEALRMVGADADALEHAEEAYRLDPADPFYLRPAVLDGFLDTGRIDDACRFLREECSEPWAAWLFGQLLVGLRRGERGPAGEKQLKEAHAGNPHVLSLLLGDRIPDPHPPYEIEPGEDSEAQQYAFDFLPAWRDTPGAISWLREAAARLELAAPAGDVDPREPIDPQQVLLLPWHEHESWIVGMYHTPPLKMIGERRGRRRWLLFAFTPRFDEIDFEVCNGRPTAGDLWNFLTSTMQRADPPSRPKQILLHLPMPAPRLRRLCRLSGIELPPFDGGEQLTPFLDQLSLRMQGGSEAAKSLPAGAIGQFPLDPDEVWEAAVTQLPQRLEVGGIAVRPWVVLVLARQAGTILWHELLMEFPPPATLAGAVRMAIASPAIGPPRRPRHILVRELGDIVALRGLSDEAGFTCEIAPELPAIESALAHLTEHIFGGEPRIVLGRIDGIAPDDLERYYTLAAEYFRAAPWKRFEMDEVVALDAVRPDAPRRFALVMGQSGITLGLAVYNSRKCVDAAFDTSLPEESARAVDGFSLTFGEESEVAPADLDAIEQFGWPIATPEAYPTVFRVLPGPQVESPTAAELRYLTAALEGVIHLARSGDQQTTVTSPALTLKVTRLGSAREG